MVASSRLCTDMPHTGLEGRPRYRLENAILNLLDLLYTDQERVFFTLTKVSRNKDIIERYKEGLPFPEIANEFGISEQRVFQIVNGRS